MIHRQFGKRQSVRGRMSCATLFAFLIGSPVVAGPARCDSGEELGILKDTGDCKRISGYIAAGARFGTDEQIGSRPSPFGRLEVPEFVGPVRSLGATIIDAPGAQDRFFLPPGPADEAR